MKNQKSVRENIARMSSKPLYRVQEEVASLKQLLSAVSTSLQRNAVIIENLKRDSTQVEVRELGFVSSFVYVVILMCDMHVITIK